MYKRRDSNRDFAHLKTLYIIQDSDTDFDHLNKSSQPELLNALYSPAQGANIVKP